MYLYNNYILIVFFVFSINKEQRDNFTDIENSLIDRNCSLYNIELFHIPGV